MKHPGHQGFSAGVNKYAWPPFRLSAITTIQHIQVIEAVAALIDSGTEAHVNQVARQLALDQSGASRMVRDAVSAGYLTREGSGRDRRRVVVTLTAQGRQLHSQALEWQQRCFDDLTSAWSDEDRHLFSHYRQRLAHEITAPNS